jgi:3-methyladenine DNA glycosylase AlkD
MNNTIAINDWLIHAKLVFKDSGLQADAVAMSAYMKNKFAFYGLKKPLRAELTKQIFVKKGIPGKDVFREIVETLWDEPYRELHYLALEILFRNKKHFLPDDVYLFEEMMRSNSWWDSIDYISPTLTFHLFKAYPELKAPTLLKWNDDSNFWLRRASIIAQLKEKKETDTSLQFKLIANLVNEKEFFIRKAIGWSLRELAKSYPEEVLNYVNTNELSTLSKKEALKHFQDVK